jgi:hypothetical protein
LRFNIVVLYMIIYCRSTCLTNKKAPEGAFLRSNKNY